MREVFCVPDRFPSLGIHGGRLARRPLGSIIWGRMKMRKLKGLHQLRLVCR